MPRIFSEQDREAIRNALIAAGKDQFQRAGLRKTSVEELARAAGIAKGTFYHFFESKEDLCFSIFDQEEKEMAGDVTAVIEGGKDPEEIMRNLFDYSIRFLKGNSLMLKLRERGEYWLLARGVGRERLAEHPEHDNDLAKILLSSFRKMGSKTKLKPDVLAGVMRATLMLSLHEDEIGEKVFPQVMQLIFRWTAAGIVNG